MSRFAMDALDAFVLVDPSEQNDTPDAAFSQEKPDGRAEAIADLLLAIYGDDALEMLDKLGIGVALAAWNPEHHPRGKDGRFIAKHSPEAIAATKDKIKGALKKPKDADSMKELMDHLNILTTAQIHGLKKEMGLRGSGKNRDELVKKIADRLDRGRRENYPEKPLDSTTSGGIIGGRDEQSPQTQERGGEMTTEELKAKVKDKGNRLTVAGNTMAVKESLKKNGWKWDAEKKHWYMDLVGAHMHRVLDGDNDFFRGLGGHLKGVQISFKGQPLWTSKTHPSKTEPGQSGETSKITVTSGSRDVDAYQVGSRIRRGGQLFVVTGYNRRQDDQGGYVHTMDVRSATEAEEKESRIADIKNELRKMTPDDIEKGMAVHRAKEEELRKELNRLEGSQ